MGTGLSKNSRYIYVINYLKETGKGLPLSLCLTCSLTKGWEAGMYNFPLKIYACSGVQLYMRVVLN